MRSLIIPVYGNEENIPSLLSALDKMARDSAEGFEVVFVVDGSPDRSHALLGEALPELFYPAQLILLSRNFGSFTAIRTGMEQAKGEYIAVMAADLQEPPTLIAEFFAILEKDASDVVFGQRVSRQDPVAGRFFSHFWWTLYRKLILPDMPRGGVDIFACNRQVKEAVLAIEEPNSSLVAQLFWVGFRRTFVPYERQARQQGESAWTFRKRLRYLLDSLFSYSDLPIMLVLWVGGIGLLVTVAVGSITFFARLLGLIEVPGYTALILVTLFFGSAILTTQGIIGCYLWRAFENTKKRPLSLLQSTITNRDANQH